MSPTMTDAGHKKRTMFFIKVDVIEGPGLSITVHPISEVQMNMVEWTVQVQNIVVGVMSDGTIQSLVEVSQSPFTLQYLGQTLFDMDNISVVERVDAYR